MFAERLRCVTTTPLGADVDPDVNWTNAISSADTGGSEFERRGAEGVACHRVPKLGTDPAQRVEMRLEPGRRDDGARVARPQDAGGRGEIPREIAGRRRRIERGGCHAGDRRAEQRRQKLLGVANDERDQVAAAEPQGAKGARDTLRRLVDVRVRTARLPARAEEDVAGVSPGRGAQRCRQRAHAGHQTAARPSTSAVTCATTCATVRVEGTSFNGMDTSNRSSSAAMTSRICNESNPDR